MKIKYRKEDLLITNKLGAPTFVKVSFFRKAIDVNGCKVNGKYGSN